MKATTALSPFFLLFAAGPAFATQAHGAPEGIYVHQFSHIFFMASMVILIYWLRQRDLVRLTGWRYIQYAALFFMLWNANVLIVHFMDEQAMLVVVEKIDVWQIRIVSPLGRWAEAWYYIGKLDHILCVPALFFLYLGLRKLLAETSEYSEDPSL